MNPELRRLYMMLLGKAEATYIISQEEPTIELFVDHQGIASYRYVVGLDVHQVINDRLQGTQRVDLSSEMNWEMAVKRLRDESSN